MFSPILDLFIPSMAWTNEAALDFSITPASFPFHWINSVPASTMNTSPELRLLCDKGTSVTFTCFLPLRCNNLARYMKSLKNNNNANISMILFGLDVMETRFRSTLHDADSFREIAQEAMGFEALHFSVLHRHSSLQEVSKAT